jgi:hypothetical protein
MLRRRSGLVSIACLLQVLACHLADAAEVIVDDFSAADKTKIIADTQILVNTTGQSKTATDFGLSGTIGGVRELTVTATVVMGGVSERVLSGVDPGGGLCYQSTDSADGQVQLVYDGGGAGLSPGDLHHAQGIKIDIAFADAASVPYNVKLTLVDTGNNSASSTQTGTSQCDLGPPCAPMLFPFTDFPGVNTRHISRIILEVDPNGGSNADCTAAGVPFACCTGLTTGTCGGAADFAVGPISTYGTPTIEVICDDGEDNDNNGFTDCADPACARALNCLNAAPLLSPGMIGLLVAMLGTVGLAGLARVARIK